MMKLFKKCLWIFMIMFQSLIGIGAGMLILSTVKVDTISANTKVGQFSVGDLSFKEAEALLTDYYKKQAATGALIIEIDRKASTLAYSDLDIAVDIVKTMESLKKGVSQNALKQFFSDPGKELNIQPVFIYNSGKLLTKCEALFSPFESEAAPERYEVEDGILKMVPHIPGRKMDYVRLEQEIKEKLFDQQQQPYRVDTKNTALFIETKAERVHKETFTTIVSKGQISLDPVHSKIIQGSIQALHGAIFEKGQEINLKAFIDFSQYSSDIEKDSLNRLATALYQAALPIDGVKILNRKPSQRAVSYTESGLEAIIEGEGANLLMKNETERPLMLLADTAYNKITFYLASNGELKSGILIVQKKDEVPPPVITDVNISLSPQETKVVSKGTPGYTAYVSRIIDDERVELYHDEYLPTSRVIEVGKKPILTSSK